MTCSSSSRDDGFSRAIPPILFAGVKPQYDEKKEYKKGSGTVLKTCRLYMKLLLSLQKNINFGKHGIVVQSSNPHTEYKREIVKHLLREYAEKGIVPKTKTAYGYKFVTDEEAEKILRKAQKEKEGGRHSSKKPNPATDAASNVTMQDLSKYPISDAVRLAIRYKLLDNQPDSEGPPTVDPKDAARLALKYTLRDDRTPLGNRDATRHVGPGTDGLPKDEQEQ